VIRHAAAVAALALAVAAGGAPTAAAAPARPPVLLAHGGLGSARDFAQMAQRLRADGYEPYTVEFPFPATDTVADARLIARRVSEIQAANGGARVHLVGHSMGGLAARYYLKKLDGLAHVASHTAVGTPQHGSPRPESCLLVPDQCPRGPVLQELNAGDDTPGPISYTSIGSTDSPDEADGSWTRLDGGACLRQVAGGPHAQEPANPVVYAAVLDGLRSTCPAGAYADLPEITP